MGRKREHKPHHRQSLHEQIEDPETYGVRVGDGQAAATRVLYIACYQLQMPCHCTLHAEVTRSCTFGARALAPACSLWRHRHAMNQGYLTLTVPVPVHADQPTQHRQEAAER